MLLIDCCLHYGWYWTLVLSWLCFQNFQFFGNINFIFSKVLGILKTRYGGLFQVQLITMQPELYPAQEYGFLSVSPEKINKKAKLVQNATIVLTEAQIC